MLLYINTMFHKKYRTFIVISPGSTSTSVDIQKIRKTYENPTEKETNDGDDNYYNHDTHAA